MRHREACQSVQEPRYQEWGPDGDVGPGVGWDHFLRRNCGKGAVKTAATSLGSRRGISVDSTSMEDVVSVSEEESDPGFEG